MAYSLADVQNPKRQWLLRGSNIPRRFLGLEPEDIIGKTGSFPEEISDWLDDAIGGRIIKSIGGLGLTGTGLLFDGDPGLGKTTHAVTALMEFARMLPDNDEKLRSILAFDGTVPLMNSRPIYYMTFPEFLSRKKALIDADPETKKNLYLEMEGFHGRLNNDNDHLNVRVLVLDDLGKEYGSKYDDTSFDEVLRSRYDKALPTIITTNVARESWAKQYGDAMGSFAFEAFTRVRIMGKDLRKS